MKSLFSLKILQSVMGYLGVMLGIWAYFPLWKAINNNVTGFSFTSYLLWSILDFISAKTSYDTDGNYLLPITFGICSTITALLLVYKKMIKIKWTDGLILFLICINFVIWKIYGAQIGHACSIISLIIASTPQVIDFAKEPVKEAVFIYKLFTFSSLASLLAAKSLNLEQIGFAMTATILCGFMWYLTNRKEPLLKRKILLSK